MGCVTDLAKLANNPKVKSQLVKSKGVLKPTLLRSFEMKGKGHSR